jgi:cytochrome P450 / NADPH-cytochrome P450 reductase
MVTRLLEADAKVMVCGDGEQMAPAVHDTLVRIHAEATGESLEQSKAWLEQLRASGRYVTDVFS